MPRPPSIRLHCFHLDLSPPAVATSTHIVIFLAIIINITINIITTIFIVIIIKICDTPETPNQALGWWYLIREGLAGPVNGLKRGLGGSQVVLARSYNTAQRRSQKDGMGEWGGGGGGSKYPSHRNLKLSIVRNFDPSMIDPVTNQCVELQV